MCPWIQIPTTQCGLNLRISSAGSATPTGEDGAANVASDGNRCFAKPLSRATLASCALITSCSCALQTLLRALDELQTRVQSFSDWGNACLSLGFGNSNRPHRGCPPPENPRQPGDESHVLVPPRRGRLDCLEVDGPKATTGLSGLRC